MKDFCLKVISDPHLLPGEDHVVEGLFAEGLDCFHLRKPEIDKDSIRKLLDKWAPRYAGNIVIHQYPELVKEYHLKGFHIPNNFNADKSDAHPIGRSLHTLEDIINHSGEYQYVFVSPLFDSISKKGYKANFSLKELQETLSNIKSTKTKYIGLGGIDTCNFSKVKHIGLHGAAVLGAIWNLKDKDQILEKFKQLKSLAELEN